MKEIIFDLLCVGKQAKAFSLNPEVLRVVFSLFYLFIYLFKCIYLFLFFSVRCCQSSSW